MNYRHHYHAGNFADVFKHAALVQLVRAMQRKDKGFLYLDTHAGRGSYDLLSAASGLTLARTPEWPDGIGRLLDADPSTLSPVLCEYLELCRAHDAVHRTAAEQASEPEALRYYPGSPRFVQELARPQDRLTLCELQPDEFALLDDEFLGARRARIERIDGYIAIKAQLPPIERRALILIDPPFEEADEFVQVGRAISEGLRRLPSATIAVWYPLTERARSEAFLDQLVQLKLPPCCVIELLIAGAMAPQKLKGCGLVVINPPWRLAPVLADLATDLAVRLAQSPGGGSGLRWLVPES